MTQQLIAITQLDRSPLNARKTDTRAGLEEMKASLLAHGLMQNLVVIPAKKGRFHVVAGGRRLDALRELLSEGKLPEGYEVPCRIAGTDQADELSLAENVVRRAMHPADEFEAFADLVDNGQTAAAVAERFGVDEKHVLKRLKLGRVAPSLLEAYQAGDIDLESLTAFTVTDDRKRQVKVYKGLSDWQKRDPGAIRDILTERMVEAGDKRVAFVGLDTYLAAGGTKRADLFADTAYLENPELLHALVAEKLKLAKQGLLAEGWGWVEAACDHDYAFTGRLVRIRPQPVAVPPELAAELERAEAERDAVAGKIDVTGDEAELDALYEEERAIEERIDALEERIEGYAAFDPERMKHSGCYATVAHDGTLHVEKGLVRKEDAKHLSADAAGEKPGSGSEKPVYSRPLFDDLQAVRTYAARLELARHRDIAFDLLGFTLAAAAFGTRLSTGPDIRLAEQFPVAKAVDLASLERQWDSVRAALPVAWLDAGTEAEQFRAFRALTPTEKLDLLAFCTAESLRPRQFVASGQPGDCAFEEALAQTGGDVAAYWRPSPEGFLSRIGRAQLLDMARQTLGEGWVRSHAKDKKSELVKRLGVAFGNPDAAGSGPGVAERLKRWLPTGMAFTHAAETPEGELGTMAA